MSPFIIIGTYLSLSSRERFRSYIKLAKLKKPKPKANNTCTTQKNEQIMPLVRVMHLFRTFSVCIRTNAFSIHLGDEIGSQLVKAHMAATYSPFMIYCYMYTPNLRIQAGEHARPHTPGGCRSLSLPISLLPQIPRPLPPRAHPSTIFSNSEVGTLKSPSKSKFFKC